MFQYIPQYSETELEDGTKRKCYVITISDGHYSVMIPEGDSAFPLFG
jgi:hypothetical protein